MIIVRLNGGLGNQMFQYAMGRATSVRNNLQLKLDIVTGIAPGDTTRPYALGHFHIVEDIASREEIESLKYPLGFFSRIMRFIRIKILRQFHEGFNPQALHIADKTYLDGFWQSWKYFDDVADIIRKDFTLKNPLSDRAKKIVDVMQQVNAVSVHVRRGDYVANPTTHAYHGTCSPEYYQQAIAHMRAHSAHPVFFVFSDDIAWVKEHIPFGNDKVFYVSDYKLLDYEELMLMASCKHHIIANSSFSWWGAWLNRNEEKMVIAPKKWFAKGNDPKDLIPPSWIRM